MRFDASFFRRVLFRIQGRVIHIRPKDASRGNVLISYTALPFLDTRTDILDGHSNRWECMEMVRAWTTRGYAVDLIDISNNRFVPQKRYDYFIDNQNNMDRLAPLLNPECIKIFHITTAYWKFQNDAEDQRLNDLYQRRGVRLEPTRRLPASHAIELCDAASMVGNKFTADTYAFAHKKIVPIPISTTHLYPFPEKKNFEAARKNFIWYGGAGLVHKGLDLVIEAFAQMPENTLTICGKIDGEKDFLKIYAHELALPNIHIAGFINPGSEKFKKLIDTSIGVVYPSCSEGGGGNIILCMHAGLIPIVSYESSVDIDDFGIIVENRVEKIIEEVTRLAVLPEEKLRTRALSAWQYARTNHTREHFAEKYTQFVDQLELRYPVTH